MKNAETTIGIILQGGMIILVVIAVAILVGYLLRALVPPAKGKGIKK